MDRTFSNFLKALRGAEVRVSVSETLDAMHTANLMGWRDRAALKDALSFVLAKTSDEKQRYDETFDRYFSFDGFRGTPPPPPGGEDEQQEDGGEGEATGGGESELAQMMLANDRAGLAQAMQQAAKDVDLAGIKFFTQRGLYIQRMLNAMGIEAVDDEIAAQARSGSGTGGQALKDARAYLFEQVRDFVEQQLSLQGAATKTALREGRLRRTKLGNLDKRDQEQMREVVQKICRRLVALHSRRQKMKNRGRLDVRRTLRRNFSNDGVLFEIEWKRKKLDRPKVMAICDVSGSVSAVARFLLQFLYELHELLHHIESFAFSAYLVETSQYFEEKEADAAVDAIMDKVGYMSTDYGQALLDFREGWLGKVDKKTTVIVLGDGRSNYTDPHAEILKEIHDRAKRVLWLNPEPPPLWGTGDSEMKRYTPYCDLVRECNTLAHLERFVGDLLRVTQKAA